MNTIIKDEDIDNISNQIRDQMKKAFNDLINEQVVSGNVDIEWFTRLYIELGEKIMNIVKNEKVRKNIAESFDDKLFTQMISNDVFDTESLEKLVNNTFYWIEKLQAPIRDEESKIAKEKILTATKENVISTFLVESHQCIENIEIDLQNYYSSLKI